MTPMQPPVADEAGQFVDVPDRDVADGRAHLGGIDVDHRRDREASLVESGVVGERLAEVAGADDHDRPVVRQPELPAHLVGQVVDLVPDPRVP